MHIRLFKLLKSKAEAEKEEAKTTLSLLCNHPAGIGDHSTEDFYKNAEEALQKLTDADDKLKTLEKYSKTIFMPEEDLPF